MKRPAITVALPFGMILATSVSALAGPPPIRGIAMGHHTNISHSLLERTLGELKAHGASHVSMVVSWSMKDVRAVKIEPRKGYTTPDRVLVRMIIRARARGLKVLVFPILDVRRRRPLEWRGTLKPTSWDEWWRYYRRFMMHYARLAAAGKAEILCIGSELVTTESMLPRWRDLVQRVRKVFKGKLLYSANWDHYKPVKFWDLVDVVGVTAYYGLAKQSDGPTSEMIASWNKVRDKLVTWSRSIKRPFVFTEVGYPSLDGGAVNPWDYTQGTAPDMEEQRRAFSAFVHSWDGTPELQGVFFWDWYGEGGPKDTRYTPRGKPAAKVIQRWFTGQWKRKIKR